MLPVNYATAISVKYAATNPTLGVAAALQTTADARNGSLHAPVVQTRAVEAGEDYSRLWQALAGAVNPSRLPVGWQPPRTSLRAGAKYLHTHHTAVCLTCTSHSRESDQKCTHESTCKDKSPSSCITEQTAWERYGAGRRVNKHCPLLLSTRKAARRYRDHR